MTLTARIAIAKRGALLQMIRYASDEARRQNEISTVELLELAIQQLDVGANIVGDVPVGSSNQAD